MKSGKNLLYSMLALFFLVSACRDNKGKDDYSGVSGLIADRNKARYEVAENPPQKSAGSKKNTVKQPHVSSNDGVSKEKELSSIVLYEEAVEIVGSDSQRILAKGVAYINKKGQIVRIKIIKE